jgi:hypothetical protein
MTVAALDTVYARRLLRRAVLLWLPVRAIMFFAAVGFQLDPRLVPTGKLLVVIVAAVLCAVDARVMRESIFHANLGTPVWAPAAAGAGFALALEAAVAGVYGLMLMAGT